MDFQNNRSTCSLTTKELFIKLSTTNSPRKDHVSSSYLSFISCILCNLLFMQHQYRFGTKKTDRTGLFQTKFVLNEERPFDRLLENEGKK
jgi:hypothetical protein